MGLISLCGAIMATQFEPHRDGFVYRRKGSGPALPVTPAERDAFVRAFGWSFLFHTAGYMLAVIAAAMLTETVFGVAGSDTTGGLVMMGGAMLVISGLGILSLSHATYAPARALADRTPVAPARDPKAMRRRAQRRVSYGSIFSTVAIAVAVFAWQGRDTPVLAATLSAIFIAGGIVGAAMKWRASRTPP